MNIEEIRDYFLFKPGTTEGLPFDEHTLVFKVENKMFGLLTLKKELRCNLKCNPDRAIELREEYAEIIPGYHMNKKHWNTLQLDGDLPEPLIKELIDHSYELVLNSLPKRLQVKYQ